MSDKKVRELMTPDPVVLQSTVPIEEAAKAMRDRNVGTVVVMEQDKLCGIVTDRDIAVRAVAQGRDVKHPLREICSQDLTTVRPDDSLEDAVRLMREKAVRRLPVTDGGKPLGIISIGDLAVERDPHSVLAGISAAPANR